MNKLVWLSQMWNRNSFWFPLIFFTHASFKFSFPIRFCLISIRRFCSTNVDTIRSKSYCPGLACYQISGKDFLLISLFLLWTQQFRVYFMKMKTFLLRISPLFFEGKKIWKKDSNEYIFVLTRKNKYIGLTLSWGKGRYSWNWSLKCPGSWKFWFFCKKILAKI